MLDKLRLAEKLRTAPTSEPVEFRYGTVVSIEDPTITVQISGSEIVIADVPVLSSYGPAVDDTIVLVKQGGDLWALGKIGDPSGVPGGGGGGGAGLVGIDTATPKRGRNVYSTWHYAGADAQFYAVESRIRIDAAPSVGSPDPGYFWATDGVISGPAGTAWYMGLQTSGPRGIIFSMWDTTAARVSGVATLGAPPASVLAPNPYQVSFGGEGVGKSIRCPNVWVVGHEYRLTLWAAEVDPGDNCRWWNFNFADLTAGWAADIGAIKAPRDVTQCEYIGGGSYQIGTWLEHFGNPVADPRSLPYASAIRFAPKGNPAGGNGPWLPTLHDPSYQGGDLWPGSHIEYGYPDARHDIGLLSL